MPNSNHKATNYKYKVSPSIINSQLWDFFKKLVSLNNNMHWTYRAFPQSLTAIFTEGIIHNHNPCHTNNNNWITFISDNFAILDNNNDSQSFIFCLRFLILLNHYQSNLHIYTLQWWWFIKNYKAYPSKNWVLKVIDCYYVLLYIILKWISNCCMVLFKINMLSESLQELEPTELSSVSVMSCL